MQFRGRKVFYDATERALFIPLWQEISKDAEFRARVEQTRDAVLIADEVGIMDGTSPLRPVLDKFAADFGAKARSVDPTLPDATLRNLQFYCLYHTEGSSEFDFDKATRKLTGKNQAPQLAARGSGLRSTGGSSRRRSGGVASRKRAERKNETRRPILRLRTIGRPSGGDARLHLCGVNCVRGNPCAR